MPSTPAATTAANPRDFVIALSVVWLRGISGLHQFIDEADHKVGSEALP
jgi:hypothetical protein